MTKRKNRKFYNYALVALIALIAVAVVLFIINKYAGSSFAGNTLANQPQPSANQIAIDNTPPAQPEVSYEDASDTAILMYHHIKVPKDPEHDQIDLGLSVPPSEFVKQMDSLVGHNSKSVSLADVFKKDEANNVVITFDDGYQDVYTNAFPIMKARGLTGTAFIITSFIGRPDYMSLEEIKALKDAGWTIGSHTLDHPDLSTASTEKARKEISESKIALENYLGITVDTFCYPSGKYSDQVISLVQQAGYKYAVTTKPGKHNVSSNVLLLKRIRINGPSALSSFNSKIYQ